MNESIYSRAERLRQEKLFQRYAEAKETEDEYKKFRKYIGTYYLSMREQEEMMDEFLSESDYGEKEE